MTARDDLLVAAHALTERGTTPFSARQLIAEARAAGSTYKDATFRTYVTGIMLGGANNHWGGHKSNEFERVERGKYVLADGAGNRQGREHESGNSARPLPRGPASTPSSSEATDHRDAWYWEGQVQAAVVSYLAAEGWQVMRVADTHSREHGVDVEARKGDEIVAIEVKGYPSAVYARGPKAGEAKPGAGVGSQARTYFGGALLTGMLMRSERPEERVVIAFPDFVTYRNLLERLVQPMKDARVEGWLVGEDGSVAVLVPGTAPARGLPQATAKLRVRKATRR